MDLARYNWVLPAKQSGGGLLARVINNRHGGSFDLQDYIQPDFALADPFLMPDMRRGVKRVTQAIKKREKVLIYGDYDVDGVTSTALLGEFFDFAGLEVDTHIPNRFKDGYGLNLRFAKKVAEEEYDLVITVDCGVRDIGPIKHLVENGVDVVVCDHHEVGDKIPECSAVINPKRNSNRYPERNLAGVGVVYTFCRALMEDIGVENGKKDWWLKWSLDLVALGTIADMMPLIGENRILAKYGLVVLSKSKRPGLKNLMRLAGINQKGITSRDVGFGIVPRLNAAGRMDDASIALNLLIEKEDLEARILAENVDRKNSLRKNVTSEILNEAIKMAEPIGRDVIALASEKWSEGVVGLVCGRLVEKYNRPCLVAKIDENKIKGSARGIEGVDMAGTLEKASDLLEKYGGHKAAAGFTLNKKNWKKFTQRINELLVGQFKDKKAKKEIIIDSELKLQELNLGLFVEVNRMEPFGERNEEPLLYSKSLKIINKRLIGADKRHVKFDLGNDRDNYVEAIFWNRADLLERVDGNKFFDWVYNIRKNNYQGRESVCLHLVDIRVSKNNF
ncbi:single-stranded-DNA-specific exonuclease RecJ [Patescibacteria group bacterium]|nr:single-stranded-DNA-specific exonuclease RecJ [Patescibacteria group bacterium]